MRIVFLLSMPRSGSTLLRLHLDRFPGAIALPETHFFVFKQQYAKRDPAQLDDRKLLAARWTNLHTIQKFPVDRATLRKRIEDEATKWDDIFHFTLDAYKAAVKPEVSDPLWIEKSPPHIFFQPAIRATFPEARFIYLIRDPRAVIGSLKTMPWSTSNVYTLARSWQRALDLSNDKGLRHFVKYEDLVREPEKVFEGLSTFLEMADAYVPPRRVDDAVEKGNWNSANALKPISTEMIEKWKLQLSAQDSDLAVIQDVCAAGMRQMGYEFLAAQKDRNYRINKWSSLVHFALLRTFGKQV